jgi:hypothetical protein
MIICFVEQIAIAPKDATVHLVGEASPAVKRFKRKWATAGAIQLKRLPP